MLHRVYGIKCRLTLNSRFRTILPKNIRTLFFGITGQETMGTGTFLWHLSLTLATKAVIRLWLPWLRVEL